MASIEDILKKGSKQNEESDQAENLKTNAKEGGQEDGGLQSGLQKVQEAKRKPEGQEKGMLDSDELLRMMMSGENTDGMVSETASGGKGEDLHSKAEGSPKVDGSKAESKGKYKDLFRDDMLKHPDKYFVETPEGKITIAEAIRKGYNPLTKNFEKEKSRDSIMEEATKGLNESDKETVKRMMDPAAARMAPDDAKRFGIGQDSPMVRKELPQEEAPRQAPAEQAPQSGAPVGGLVPGGETESGNPLNALLGGK